MPKSGRLLAGLKSVAGSLRRHPAFNLAVPLCPRIDPPVGRRFLDLRGNAVDLDGALCLGGSLPTSRAAALTPHYEASAKQTLTFVSRVKRGG